jgi:hypothetical protein
MAFSNRVQATVDGRFRCEADQTLQGFLDAHFLLFAGNAEFEYEPDGSRPPEPMVKRPRTAREVRVALRIGADLFRILLHLIACMIRLLLCRHERILSLCVRLYLVASRLREA